MSSQIIEKAIRDVIPTLSGQVPERLQKLTTALYEASSQKVSLKPTEEAARPHLAAYVAADRLQEKLNLADHSLQNFPVPPRVAAALIGVFRNSMYSTGAASSPSTPLTTPRKRQNPTPMAQTPVSFKKLAAGTTTPLKTNAKGKPGRPPGSKTKSPFHKRLEEAAATSANDDTDQDPQWCGEEEEDLLQKPSASDLRLLTSREITSLCNKFELDAETAANVLETFQKYSTRVSNEWSLIVGLVLNCYFVVNHKALQEKIGSKTAAIKTMRRLQNGGLMAADIDKSIEVVRNLIVYNKWFKVLKAKCNYPSISEKSSSSSSSLKNPSSMITPNYQFSSKSANEEFDEWVAHVQNQLELQLQSN